MEVFLYFFELKHSGRHLWVSLNDVPGRGLLTLFQSSYKNFKGRFVKVHASAEDSSLLDGSPLYWSPNPRFLSARHLEDLSLRERGICEFLENLKVVFDTPTLWTKEYLPGALKAYIGIPLFHPYPSKGTLITLTLTLSCLFFKIICFLTLAKSSWSNVPRR